MPVPSSRSCWRPLSKKRRTSRHAWNARRSTSRPGRTFLVRTSSVRRFGLPRKITGRPRYESRPRASTSTRAATDGTSPRTTATSSSPSASAAPRSSTAFPGRSPWRISAKSATRGKNSPPVRNAFQCWWAWSVATGVPRRPPFPDSDAAPFAPPGAPRPRRARRLSPVNASEPTAFGPVHLVADEATGPAPRSRRRRRRCRSRRSPPPAYSRGYPFAAARAGSPSRHSSMSFIPASARRRRRCRSALMRSRGRACRGRRSARGSRCPPSRPR